MLSHKHTFCIFQFALTVIFTTLFFINFGNAKEHSKHEVHLAEKTVTLNVKLHTEPKAIKAGEPASLIFHLTDENGEPFTDLLVHHDRILHVLIVSENLQILGHVHPEDFESRDMMLELEGMYTVHFTFPVAGKYILALDVMSADTEIAKYLYVDVEGEEKMSEMKDDFRTEKVVFGYTEEGGDRYTKAVSITDEKGTVPYHVKIGVPEQIKAGEMVHISYHFMRDGKPVSDLVPFLDAPMHFAIVNTRLDGILHTHGTVPTSGDSAKITEKDPHAGHKMEKPSKTGHQHQGITPDRFGPAVMLMTTFPKAGHYQIFGQVKHGNQILFPTFMVKVIE